MKLIPVMTVLALATSCGNESRIGDPQDEEGNASSPIPESALATFVAEAQCDQQMSCDCYLLTGPVGEDPAEYTRNKCVENRGLELSHWQRQMQAAGLQYDGECAARRLAGVQEWACLDPLAVVELELEQRDCSGKCRVYHGDVPLGGECEPSIDDCARGLSCRIESYDPVRGDPTYRCISNCGGNGAPCAYDECAPGFYCRSSYETGGASSTCAPLPLVGQACPDYVCGASFCNETNLCAAFIEDGASCSPSIPCRGACIDNVCRPGRAYVCDWDLRD